MKRILRIGWLVTLGWIGVRVSGAEQLIADFEGADFGDWTVSGTAFGTGPASGALPDQSPVGGFRGRGFANSFHGQDRATGRLTSPEFTLTHRYLSFLIGGGEEVGATCVSVTVDGQVVRSATGREDDFLNTATFDLGEFAGRKARLRVVDGFGGSWGHISADHFVLSDTAATPPYVQNPEPTPSFHDELLRPQFHFSAHSGGLSDPTGLVRFGDGNHLFFPHNPTGPGLANATWGHAVSTNFVHWNEWENTLLPDSSGLMSGGSVVVDRDNAAGFQSGGDPALVAIFTAAGRVVNAASAGQTFSQCLAYSNDRGRTWTRYPGNPVLPATGEGGRDPKVFWHAASKYWVMLLYVGEPDSVRRTPEGKPLVRHTCQFYQSLDLKIWNRTGTFAAEVHESPGLVKLPVDGDPADTRWVLWGADGAYWIGQFDGRQFIAGSPRLTGDFGANFHAAQAWDALPDGRVILIGWMRGGEYPGMPFNQQMSFPVELTVQSSPEGLRLVKWPVSEIRSLVTSVLREDLRRPLPPGEHPLPGTVPELLDLEIEFIPGTVRMLQWNLRGQALRWNAADASLVVLGRTIPSPVATRSTGRRSEFPPPWGPDLVPWDGSVRWRVLMDRTSLEVFVNGGIAVGSFCFVPKEAPSMSLLTEGGDVQQLRVIRRTLKSAWRP